MAEIDALKRGREAFGKQVWGDAFARLSNADREQPLEGEDLERLAITAYMVGKDDVSADAWTRAHHHYLRGQNPAAAARCAFWHACGLFFKGDMAPAMGWVARGRRVLETAKDDCPEQGWLLFLTALPIMFQGEPETAHQSFVQAGEIAERFNDPDVMTLSRLGRGQSQGAWTDALEAAELACEWLSGPTAWDSLGSAYYQLGEIERLRGEFEKAEQAYRQASRAGRQPEPGMSLLRLAQHQVEVAAAAIRRALDETQEPLGRSRLLPAYVEIMLAADDFAAARSAADELAEIAAGLNAPFLHAVAASSGGAVLLAEGDAQAALARLRDAFVAWRGLDAPHHAASVRVLIGRGTRAR